jgi:hypothetical protein
MGEYCKYFGGGSRTLPGPLPAANIGTRQSLHYGINDSEIKKISGTTGAL